MELKKIIKVHFAGFLGAVFLRAINRTLRWSRVGFEGELKFWAAGQPAILAFWHGRQLMMPWSYLKCFSKKRSENRSVYVLISAHTDGRMIAKAMSWLGIKSVAGSSSRGGKEAFHELIRIIKEGDHIAITPDGPKGPVHVLKDGAIRIAQRTGAPIYPAAFGAEKRWTFKSWDRMILPKPFSKAVMIMAEPIYVPADCSEDELKIVSEKLRTSLNDVLDRADNYNYS